MPPTAPYSWLSSLRELLNSASRGRVSERNGDNDQRYGVSRVVKKPSKTFPRVSHHNAGAISMVWGLRQRVYNEEGVKIQHTMFKVSRVIRGKVKFVLQDVVKTEQVLYVFSID